MADTPGPELGRLFPLGGPVPPELVIGRTGEIDEISGRLREGFSTLLSGERRIGKTTVCDAACEAVRREDAVIVKIEVPERSDNSDLLQEIVDRTSRISLAAQGRKLIRLAKPMIERFLAEEGIPLDLSELGLEPSELPTRAILSLPARLGEETKKRVVFYLDELQRVASYEDGEKALLDLVDIYAGRSDVVVLVDGSDERVMSGLVGAPLHLGKLCGRVPLSPEIPKQVWREGLPERFSAAGLELEPAALAAVVEFGAGRPFATMAASRYTALNARKLGSTTVGAFEAEEGVAEARRHLDEDE